MIMDKFTALTLLTQRARRLAADQSGAVAIEYVMIASVVSIVILAALSGMGVSVKGMYQSLSDLMH
jgi:Flp pilus assembly pilin Flp